VAKALRDVGLGTLLFRSFILDEEAEDLITGKQRFDKNLLARRLVGVTDWLLSNKQNPTAQNWILWCQHRGCSGVGGSRSKAQVIAAVVSRGGRPDLAAPVLDSVKAPTLLIVGGKDFQVVDMNRQALAKLRVEKDLVIIPGATHLFEEPGALEQVAKLAREWFIKLSHHRNLMGNDG